MPIQVDLVSQHSRENNLQGVINSQVPFGSATLARASCTGALAGRVRCIIHNFIMQWSSHSFKVWLPGRSVRRTRTWRFIFRASESVSVSCWMIFQLITPFLEHPCSSDLCSNGLDLSYSASISQKPFDTCFISH